MAIGTRVRPRFMRTALEQGPARPKPPPQRSTVVLDLVTRLFRALREEGVSYVHWKSNEALDRSASGDNDLDLLVRRCDVGRYLAVLASLGFKQARVSPARDMPGVMHHYGLDVPSGRLVHVHWQSQLILGDDMTKNYRVPMEEAYLGSAVQGPVFAVPSADHELALFVLRMVLKHGTWDAIAYGRGRLGASERRELTWLEERADLRKVLCIVNEHLPGVDEGLWLDCRAALDPEATVSVRATTAHRLRAALAAHGRYSPAHDTALRVWRRAAWGTRRYVLGKRTRKTLVNGGAVIGIVGGDGSGKSSAVRGLHAALSRPFVVKQVHLGKPRRSLTTLAVKGPMYIGRRVGMFPSTAVPAWETTDGNPAPTVAWLLWHALNARDRHRAYTRARRFAGAGGLVVCDRFPLAELTLMDGARTREAALGQQASWAAGRLGELERQYYAATAYPDVLVVLRLDPAVAVSRRGDEDEEFVRRRNQEVWERDWNVTPAVVVDASQPQDAVLREILALVWCRL